MDDNTAHDMPQPRANAVAMEQHGGTPGTDNDKMPVDVPAMMAAASVIDHSPETTKHNPLIFGEGGDLRLDVGPKKMSCIVSSKALARASEFFQTVLYRGGSESRHNSPAGEWVVQLPDDDINAMSILLAIVHGCSQAVPKKLPTNKEALLDPTSSESFHAGYADAGLLYLVARAADKYGLTQLLKPWADSWLDDFRGSVRRIGKHCGEILWAVWLFGDEDQVSYQLDQFVLSAMQEMDDDGELTNGFVVHDGFGQEIHAWSTETVSHQILHILGVWEIIRPTSLRIMDLFLGHLKSFLNEPTTYMDPRCARCAWHMGVQGPCTDMAAVVERLQNRLKECELFPLPEPQDWLYDVEQLRYCIDTLAPAMLLPGEELGLQLRCRHCKPYMGLLTALRGVRAIRPLIHLSEAQRAFLSQKRRESGVVGLRH